MSTAVSLDRSLQYLIDIRLDTLDRVLMDSGVSRAERSEIVQAVEDQIAEKLGQQGDRVTREAVLQLLRSLDPPEAYCREGAGSGLIQEPARTVRRKPLAGPQAQCERWQSAAPAKYSGLAIASFVLALLSIPTIIIIPLGSILALAGLVCALFALPAITASHGRLLGRWMAIFACVTFALHLVAIVCVLWMAMS